jgi:signal transduction histidine kinase
MAGILASVLAEVRVHRGNPEGGGTIGGGQPELAEAEDAVRGRPAGSGGTAFGRSGARFAIRWALLRRKRRCWAQLSAENEVAREVAGFISTEVDRTNALVTRFLDFARPLKLHLSPGDLVHVLDRAVELAERDAAGRRVAIFKNYSPDIPPLPMDAELMERVFYNLLVNAVQATPPEGAVTIKTRGAGGMAEVCVIDRGSGINTNGAKPPASHPSPYAQPRPIGARPTAK